MSAQVVAPWGVSPNPTAARSHAIYERVPEGIMAGFIGGAVVGGLGALVLSKGTVELFPFVMFAAIFAVFGSVPGALIGLVYASRTPRKS